MRSHAQYDKQYTKETYWFYRSRGICTCCHKAPAFNGRTSCPDCIEKRAEYDANRDKGYLRRKAKERADRLLAAGICRDCGKRPVKAGCTRCDECAKKTCLRIKQRNAENRVRKPAGLCRRRGCENPVVTGKRTCAIHYPEMVKRAELMRTHCDNSNHIWRRYTGAEIPMIRGR